MYILINKHSFQVDIYFNYYDAIDAGVTYISEFGFSDGWSTDEINDEIYYFSRFGDCSLICLKIITTGMEENNVI